MKLAELKAMLEARGLAPRSRFGQNFLIDPALLARIPVDAGVQPGEPVIETGPGAGALTSSLLAAGAQVLAVEIDAGLHAWLKQYFETEIADGQLQLVHGDMLDREERFHPEVEAWWQAASTPPRLVSNLPYSISGPFLGRLPGRALSGACLLLQKEVAHKAVGRESGALPVRLQLNFETTLGRSLPPEVFWPRPQIASAFLHLVPRDDAPSAEENQMLTRILGLGFGQRRKQLLSRLCKQYPQAAEYLREVGVVENARPEELDAEQWLGAARAQLV